MNFTYQPLTEEQIQLLNLWPEGDYKFQTIRAIEKVSQTGAPMIEIHQKIWNEKGEERVIYDYFLNTPNWIFKLKHYCDTTGLDSEYKNGTFNASLCQDKEGWLRLIIQPESVGKDGKRYSAKNSVKDYINIVPLEQVISNVPTHPHYNATKDLYNAIKDLNDDVPF